MKECCYNEWLDEYNDYIRLYRLFGDAEYMEKAKEILNRLKANAVRMQYNEKLFDKIRSGKQHML